MGKDSTVLTPKEIDELQDLVGQCFVHLADLRKKSPLAKHIKNIQIPSHLSEPIAFHLVKKGAILSTLKEHALVWNTDNRKPDIVATNENGQPFNIEVKATAASEFQSLSAKDIASDYLIWIQFGNFFISPTRPPITIHVLPRPKLYLTEGRIRLKTFLRKGGEAIQSTTLKLSEAL